MTEPRREPHPANTLNELPGEEWLYFTKSIWGTAYPSELGHAQRRRHGANKPPRLKPTAGKVATCTPVAVWTACWSTSLGEIKTVTAHPRCRNCSATARPGNKCPPVPPHAMATLKLGVRCCIRKTVVRGRPQVQVHRPLQARGSALCVQC